MSSMPMIYIIMGVSSSGKTVIGSRLAKELDLPFFDGDEFHPFENIKKMESGEPLNDEDRLPWLQKLSRNMVQWEKAGGAVLACSALKRTYRDILSPPKVPVRFIFLKGSKKLIGTRMAERDNHFMPQSLLDSQFEALEEPEEALVVDISRSPETIVQELLQQLDSSEH